MMKRLLLTIGAIFVFALSAVAQKVPEMFFEFESIPGSVIRGESMNFMAAVYADPAYIAVVVVSGPDESVRWHRRWLMENEFLWRNFDTNRVIFAKRLTTGVPKTEFWKATAGTLPAGVEDNWNYVLPAGAKPSILMTGGFDASEAAQPANEIYVSRFLRANPGSRTNIVIRCMGRRCFDEISGEVRTAFGKAGVPKRKVRYYYVPIRDEYYSIEYWILP